MSDVQVQQYGPYKNVSSLYVIGLADWNVEIAVRESDGPVMVTVEWPDGEVVQPSVRTFLYHVSTWVVLTDDGAAEIDERFLGNWGLSNRFHLVRPDDPFVQNVSGSSKTVRVSVSTQSWTQVWFQ